MLLYLQKRYARMRLAAYVDGELSATMRRFVARLIDEHSDLYTEYIQLRDSRQQLERELPTLGRATNDQMQRLWTHIDAQLRTPDAVPATQSKFAMQPRFSLSYGLAVLMCAAALMLPLVFDTNAVNAALPAEMPAPISPGISATPSVAQPTDTQVVAFSAETEASNVLHNPHTKLNNTPVPTIEGQS